MFEFIALSVLGAVGAAILLNIPNWVGRTAKPKLASWMYEWRRWRELPKAQIEARFHPAIVEIVPVGRGTSVCEVAISVTDFKGRGLDGARVLVGTDQGVLTPASEVNTSSVDGVEGRAVIRLNCSGPLVSPGIAHLSLTLVRPSKPITLFADVIVVGPTCATGLSLTMTPGITTCGDMLRVTASAVDAAGHAVADGTVIYLTCDDGAQFIGFDASGSTSTDAVTYSGSASVLVQTGLNSPGIHSIAAHVKAPDPNGKLRPAVGTILTYQTEVFRPALVTFPSPSHLSEA